MRVTMRRFTEIWRATHDGSMPSIDDEVAVRSFGVEIVPDPEPELPPRPWILEIGERVVIRASDGSVVVDIREMFGNPERLRPALGAYNAAGERKIAVSKNVFGQYGTDDEFTYKWRDQAIGSYVSRHASDLGLEIVES